jgi:hypothetical protein
MPLWLGSLRKRRCNMADTDDMVLFRKALALACAGDVESAIATALCKIDGHDPDALWSIEGRPAGRAWRSYLPKAAALLSKAVPGWPG